MVSLRRRVAVAAACLIASSCSGSEDDSAVLPIQVDGSNAGREVTLYNYFPGNVVARPGDTLRFTVSSSGEPHTIAFGTLVDQGMAVVKKANLRSVEEAFFREPPEISVMPSVFGATEDFKPENQAAGQPCFLDSGTPPVPDACPERKQPAFDGTQAFYNSGLIENDATFEVKLADSIKPGTYNYMNLIYRELMAGTVTVVGKGQPRPGPDEVARQGQNELQRALSAVAPDLAAARQATPARAVAGVQSPSSPTAVGMVFEPRQATIPVGGSVTWSVYLCHTITFNPPDGAYGDLKKVADGSVRLNPIPYTPAQAPAQSGFMGNFDGGRWNGQGFYNSGGLCSLSPGAITYKLTFTRPGTYQYVCLFHPAMVGSITVA